MRELDREITDRYEIIVKASEDCTKIPQRLTEFDSSDDTLLRIIINVTDINDNPPIFTKRVFTGGITTEADFGTEFMQVKVRLMIHIYFN